MTFHSQRIEGGFLNLELRTQNRVGCYVDLVVYPEGPKDYFGDSYEGCFTALNYLLIY